MKDIETLLLEALELIETIGTTGCGCDVPEQYRKAQDWVFNVNERQEFEAENKIKNNNNNKSCVGCVSELNKSIANTCPQCSRNIGQNKDMYLSFSEIRNKATNK